MANSLGLHFLGNISLGTQYARDTVAKPNPIRIDNKPVNIAGTRCNGCTNERDYGGADEEEFSGLEGVRGG